MLKLTVTLDKLENELVKEVARREHRSATEQMHHMIIYWCAQYVRGRRIGEGLDPVNVKRLLMMLRARHR